MEAGENQKANYCSRAQYTHPYLIRFSSVLIFFPASSRFLAASFCSSTKESPYYLHSSPFLLCTCVCVFRACHHWSSSFTPSVSVSTAMREQVVVLQPSLETSLSLRKKEQPLHNTGKESRNWTASERVNEQNIELTERDQVEVKPASAEEKIKAEETVTAPPGGACEEEEEKALEEGRLVGERMETPLLSNGKGGLFLQWGVRRRSRISRVDTHNPSSRVDNNNLMPNSVADGYSVLYNKTIHAQADRASVPEPNIKSLASKETLKAKNGIGAKREQLLSQEKHNQQSKVAKAGSLDVKQGSKGSSPGGGRRGCSSHLQKDQLVIENRTCSLADPPKLTPQDHCVTPQPSGNDASLSKNEFVWPKLTIPLSRKEKEEDFLILKGTKLPQRPSKRRPKAVEKALHYCFPGGWLVDLSLSRYDVTEKKRVRKKPRGLKAMESLGNDSD